MTNYGEDDRFFLNLQAQKDDDESWNHLKDKMITIKRKLELALTAKHYLDNAIKDLQDQAKGEHIIGDPEYAIWSAIHYAAKIIEEDMTEKQQLQSVTIKSAK